MRASVAPLPPRERRRVGVRQPAAQRRYSATRQGTRRRQRQCLALHALQTCALRPLLVSLRGGGWLSEQRLLQRAGKRKLQNRCAALLTVSRLALLPPRVRLWEQSHPHVRAAVGCEQTRRSCGRTLHSPASGRVQAGDALSRLRYASWMAGGVEARPQPAGGRPPPLRPAAASPVKDHGRRARVTVGPSIERYGTLPGTRYSAHPSQPAT